MNDENLKLISGKKRRCSVSVKAKLGLILLFNFLLFWNLNGFGCTTEMKEETDDQNTDKKVTLKIDENKTFQEIRSFGASDAWRCQFVGENWPIEKRKKMADLIFSLENDEAGNLRGIGLSNWRYYIGSGSTEQGNPSNIENVWRRTECFLDYSGNYVCTKCKGQRWFLNAAKKRGVPKFTAFTISAPVFQTKNGLAYSRKDDMGLNLKANKYDDYSKYLVDVIEYFEKHENVHFDYISPFNESQWDWSTGRQEGTPASAIRSGDCKLVENYETNTFELYNLKYDIGETNDLSDVESGIVKQQEQELEAWLTDVEASFPIKGK